MMDICVGVHFFWYCAMLLLKLLIVVYLCKLDLLYVCRPSSGLAKPPIQVSFY